MIDPTIGVIGAALIAAVPATIAALSSWRTGRSVRSPSNGLAARVKRLEGSVEDLRAAWDRHVIEHEEMVTRLIEEIRRHR